MSKRELSTAEILAMARKDRAPFARPINARERSIDARADVREYNWRADPNGSNRMGWFNYRGEELSNISPEQVMLGEACTLLSKLDAFDSDLLSQDLINWWRDNKDSYKEHEERIAKRRELLEQKLNALRKLTPEERALFDLPSCEELADTLEGF